MKAVLDASAGLRGVAPQTGEPAILEILSRATEVVAPEHYVVEVTSGLWKYVIAKELVVREAVSRLDVAFGFVERYESSAALADEALREAAARRHSVYDMFYVVLARRENAALVTVDSRLRKLEKSMGVAVLP